MPTAGKEAFNQRDSRNTCGTPYIYESMHLILLGTPDMFTRVSACGWLTFGAYVRRRGVAIDTGAASRPVRKVSLLAVSIFCGTKKSGAKQGEGSPVECKSAATTADWWYAEDSYRRHGTMLPPEHLNTLKGTERRVVTVEVHHVY